MACSCRQQIQQRSPPRSSASTQIVSLQHGWVRPAGRPCVRASTATSWRIAWTKFYFGLDLAVAFGETGEWRYQDAWERLVRSWHDQVPIGMDSTDTVARRLLNWVYAWNRFADAPCFTGLRKPLDTLIL